MSRTARTAACTTAAASGTLEKKGMAWVMGAFVFCPCHLPLTLAVLGMLLGGTAAGAALADHPLVAAGIVTLVWAAGTWRGFALIRSAHRYAAARREPAMRS